MNNYNEQDYLAHYGVLGMKWGVRKDPQRAYTKATKKFNKLSKKSDKAYDRMARRQKRSTQRIEPLAGREWNARRAGINKRKSRRYAKRASKWLDSMKKEFSNQLVVEIEPSLDARAIVLSERARYLKTI